MNCIFCDVPNSNAIGVEHIIPHSFGSDISLPGGTVCGKCNNYLSKIDSALFSYGFSAIMRPILLHKTKKKKYPKIDLGNLVIERINEDTVAFNYKDSNKAPIFDSENKTITYNIEGKSCDLQKVSRALHKIAFEWLFYNDSNINLIKYGPLRDYIRRPKRQEFRRFAQKNINMSDCDPCSIRLQSVNESCYCFISIYDVEYFVAITGEFPNRFLTEQGYRIVQSANEHVSDQSITILLSKE